MTIPDPPQSPVHVIIGATGGIGSELARRLAQNGARLFLAARSSDRLEALGASYSCPVMTVDARDFDQVDALFQKAKEHYQRIDGAVCCVGSILLKAAHLTSHQEFMDTMQANLATAFATVRSAARMMSSPGGSIALVSSAAGQIGLANHEAISAAKAGIIGLVRSAAATYAPRGIRVNAVAPGLTRTPLSERLLASEASLKASTAMHPLGRIGEPSDVASALEWFLDPRNSWVTGQILGVDGGLAHIKPRS